MPDLSPLKFKVAIQDEATGQLDKIEQEFAKLKDKTISVKVEGLSDLQHLLSALQTQQVGNLGKEVGKVINEASQNLQKEAQDAVRASLGNLAKDLVLIKEAIQHDNFTAFSTRIEKCAQAVNTLDAAFKQFQVTIGADAGMKNFMTGLGEVIRNVRTTMGTLEVSKNGGSLSSLANTYTRNVERMEDALFRLQEARAKVSNAIKSAEGAGMDSNVINRWRIYLQVLDAYEKKLQNIKADDSLMNGRGWQTNAFGTTFKHLLSNASDFEKAANVFIRAQEKLSAAREKAMGMNAGAAAQSGVSLFSGQNTEEIRKQVDAVGALYSQIQKLERELGRAGMAMQTISPTRWDELLKSGLYQKGVSYEAQMAKLRSEQIYPGDMKQQAEIIRENIERLRNLISIFKEGGYDVKGYEQQLSALLTTYEKFAALQPVDLGKKLGLEHVKGYTGPSSAATDTQWAAMKHQAEVQEVAGEAAKRHRKKLEELTNAFAQHDAQVAKSQRVQEGDNKVRQESAAALRRQAQELVKARMEMLRTQSADLGKLLSMGRGTLGSEQYEAVRNALRGVREEMSQLEGVMQRLDSYSTRELFNFGRGSNMNYSPLISNTQKLVEAKEQAASASQQLSAEEQRLAQALNHTTQAAHGQSQVLSDLKSMATQYLGVWGGQQFLHNIIETGGQLEMQRMSIGAILQNTSQANELFSRIKGLATQSPFGVVQLDQMTKQLTAYGFKYNELYDMTKRLADISAATGTDVSRLALALGHVRSEAALSGYTLRQFAMGNVPLLEKLSERLGKTTKEIREMTKKKEIGYDDVVAVLKDLTDEGGMFYNMQEVISESVKAKFKNVRDAMDIMYGEMAEGATGEALKEIANVLMELTKNWKDVATVMGTVAGVWAIHRAAILAMNAALGSNTASVVANMLAYKQKRAAELQGEALTRKLTAEELALVATRKQITAANIRVALSTNAMTKGEALRLVGLRKLSLEEAKALIRSGEFTAAEVRMAMQGRLLGFSLKRLGIDFEFAGIKFGKAGMMLKLFAVNAKAAMAALLASPWTWAMAGLTAFMELWQRNSSEMEKAADLAEAITERMTEGVKNARKIMQDTSMTFKVDGKEDIGNYGIKKGSFSFPSASDLSTDQMEKSIKVWEEFIKNYSATPNLMLNAAYATKENGEAVHSLAEQYKIMGENAATVMNALPLLKSVSTAIEEGIKDADKGLFDDSLLTDIKQYEKTYKKLYKSISSSIGYHKLEATAALNAAKENKAFKQAIEDAGISSENTAGQIALLTTEQGKYSAAVKNFRKTYDELTQRGASQSFFLTGETVGAWREVEEEFNEVADNIEKRLTAEGWNFKQLKPEEIQALAMSLAEAFTQAGLDVDAVKDKVMQLCKTRWNIPVDAKTAKAAAEISAIERQLDKLVGRKFSVNIGTSTNFFDIVDNIQKAYKTAREQINMAPPILLHFGIKMSTAAIGKLSDKEISRLAGGNFLKEMLLKAVQQAQKTVEDSLSFANAYGVKLEEPKQKGEKKSKSKSKGGSKADKELEAARTRLDLAKKILDEYKKYTKDNRYTSAGAIDIISSIFGVGKGQVSSTVNDYIGTLDKIGNSIKGTTEARKKFRQEVDKLKTDTLFDRETETIKRNVDVMKEWLDKMSKQWKLYHDLYKKTGDESFANLAFGEVMDWDDVSQREYARLRELIKERAKNDKTLKSLIGENGEVGGFSLRMTREAATDTFGGRNADIIELYMKLQALMLSNGELMLKQSAEAKAKALTEQEKLNELLREREDINKKLALLPEDRKGERQGLIWQRNAKDKEISKQRWEVFKVENDWGRVFGDLDNMSLQTIKDMIDAMNDFAGNISSEDVKTIKAYYEALQKLEDQLINKDAFRQIPNLLNNVREKKEEEAAAKLALDKVMEAVKRGDTGADEAKVVVEKQYKKAQDATTKSMNNLRKAISRVANDLQQLGSSLSQLGNMVGGKGGKLLGAFGNAFSGLGNGLEGLSKASTMEGFSQVTAYVSAYTALASTMYEFNMSLKEVLPNEQKLYKHYARKQAEINKMRKAVDDYRISVAKANSEEENWLYSNGMSELKTKAKEWKAAVDAYQNTYFQPQAIYQNSKSSFKKNIGGILGAVAGVAAGVLIPGIGMLIGGAIGAAIGQGMQSGIESLIYGQGYTPAYDNLRIETRRRSRFHGQRTQDLQSWVKENYGEDLFSKDKMTGAYLINVELMQNVMEEYGHLLVGETKETVEALMEYAEQIKEFTNSIREYVSNAFSPLADNMTDAIWDWIANGTNALDSFKKYASDTFKQIAQDAVKSFLKVNILDGFKDELEGLFGAYGLGQLSEQELMKKVATLAGQIGFQFQQTLPVMQEALRVMDSAFTAQGYDIVNGNNGESGTSSTIKGVTETTADILASYMNAIRADVSVNRGLIANFVTVLWPEYQKSYIDHVTAVSRIDTNVQAIMIMMRDGDGAMYRAISSMASKLANVIDGIESISVR